MSEKIDPWDNPISKKIRNFKIQISKAAYETNSRKQSDGLEAAYSEIIK